MKKLVCFVLCLLLLVPSALAEKDVARDQWLYEKSLECAVIMGKMAQSDKYISSMMSLDSISDLLSEVRAQDFANPAAMRVYGFQEAILSLTINVALGQGIDEDVRQAVLSRTRSSISSLLLGQAGANAAALGAILAYSTACRQPDAVPGSMLVILDYEGKWSVAVTFEAYPEQVMTVNAMLIPASDTPLTVPFVTAPPEVYRGEALEALAR
jgi:hypothetical protein